MKSILLIVVSQSMTPGDNAGPKPPSEQVNGGIGYNNIINCDDEEDCIAGSGSGDGPTSNQFPATGSEANGADGRIEIWYPEGTDSKYICCVCFLPFAHNV